MAKKKFYAVRKGIQTGIFNSWEECKKQIDGFSGAEYKGFLTENEAKLFLEVVVEEVAATTNETIDDEVFNIDDETLVAFVDGTYSKESDLYGYGIVFVNNKGEEDTLYGSDDNKSYIESKNVAGELEGVKLAITHALVQEYRKIIIYYDYEGIEKWANKSWAANKAVSKDYVDFIDGMKFNLEIVFKKVIAHTGIKYNEKADNLARKSLVQRGIKTKTEGTISISGIDKEEFEGIFEILKELNPEITVNEKAEFENRLVHIVALGKDKIVVTLYDNGNTLIQGKQSTLLELFTTLVVELLPDDKEVIELLNTYNHHLISIPKSDIDKAFVELLPNFDLNKTNDQTLVNTLKQAVYNILLDGERPDYTDLLTPVFRALEYYLYEILIDKGIIKRYDGRHGFNCFDSHDKVTYYLQQGHQSKFDDKPERLTYVNNLYNLYHKYRNVYMHWDKTGLTESIDTLQDAKTKIKEHLNDFNNYYVIF